MTHLLLNRLSFGPTTTTLNKLEKMGYEAYLEEQLHPDGQPIADIEERKSRFKFVANNHKNQSLKYYDAPLKQSWDLLSQSSNKLKQLPTAELFVNTCFHALYSPWQLQELLVQFWHNHFNISIAGGAHIGVSMPSYDKMIRQQALGNFRSFLEAVAKSPAMLYYLNNVTSRASPANENYARELMELHTLGQEAYLEEAYANWKDVPGAKEGKAVGYVEDDVHEVARAFTGWTVADGSSTHQMDGRKPNKGEFMYLASWHDDYQKRVLGVEIPSHQAPMKDGQQVLDILARHERTAHFLCTKLCRYFVADDPPPTLVKRAAKLWQQQHQAPDQIRQVLRLILSSKEFHASLGKKFKTPFELVLSLLRGTEASVTPNLHLRWMLRQMGQQHLSWPAPNGFPDTERYWSSSNLLLQRWNVMPKLLYSNWHFLFDNFKWFLPEGNASSQDLVRRCAQRLLGTQAAANFPHHEQLVQLLLRENKTPNQPPIFYNKEDQHHQVAQVWAALAMSPQFQYR